MSDYAAIIDQAVQKPRSEIRNSVLGHSEAIEELYDVWEECRTPGWDGYGALAVEQDTFTAAYMLISTLPLSFMRPSIGVEPDGQLTLEWRKSPSRVLSVSVDPNGLLHYAIVSGMKKHHDTLAFFSTAPQKLLQLVRSL